MHERDLYLAWSLKRSKAVNGARAVVGVVGKGHLRGVCYALTHDAREPVISSVWMASWCQLLCALHSVCTDELQSAFLGFGGSLEGCRGMCMRLERHISLTPGWAAAPMHSGGMRSGQPQLSRFSLHLAAAPIAPSAGAQLRFRDLVGGKNVKADRQRQRMQAAGRFAFDTALFTLLWWAWTQL